MHRASDQLFAGPCFAGNQNRFCVAGDRSTNVMNLCMTGLARMNCVSSIFPEIIPARRNFADRDSSFQGGNIGPGNGTTTAISAFGFAVESLSTVTESSHGKLCCPSSARAISLARYSASSTPSVRILLPQLIAAHRLVRFGEKGGKVTTRQFLRRISNQSVENSELQAVNLSLKSA